MKCPAFPILLLGLLSVFASANAEEWITVKPTEFTGAINNPLKGFRDFKAPGYGLIVRQYIKWSDIEAGDGDSVDRIIAHTNEITQWRGKRFEDLNVKLVPRVYLDWGWQQGHGGEAQTALARRPSCLRLRQSGLSRAA